VAIWF
jgi:hypothetical protein